MKVIIKKITSHRNDLFCDVGECKCPSPSFIGSDIEHLMKKKIKFLKGGFSFFWKCKSWIHRFPWLLHYLQPSFWSKIQVHCFEGQILQQQWYRYLFAIQVSHPFFPPLGVLKWLMWTKMLRWKYPILFSSSTISMCLVEAPPWTSGPVKAPPWSNNTMGICKWNVVPSLLDSSTQSSPPWSFTIP